MHLFPGALFKGHQKNVPIEIEFDYIDKSSVSGTIYYDDNKVKTFFKGGYTIDGLGFTLFLNETQPDSVEYKKGEYVLRLRGNRIDGFFHATGFNQKLSLRLDNSIESFLGLY